MKKIVLSAFLILSFISLPLSAQVKDKSQELGLAAGGMMGDDLTKDGVLHLGDKGGVSLRYSYNLSQTFALEGNLFYSPNYTKVNADPTTDLSSREWAGSGFNLNDSKEELDAHFGAVDLNGIFYINPESNEVVYISAGPGIATASIDRTNSDNKSITGNAATGVKFYFAENAIFRVEGKYRYVDKLIDGGDSMNLFEATMGVSWEF